MRTFLIVTISVLFYNNGFSDYPPILQSVIKVEMKSGQSFEGFYLLHEKSKCCGNLNGFANVDDDGNYTIYQFSLKKKIIINKKERISGTRNRFYSIEKIGNGNWLGKPLYIKDSIKSVTELDDISYTLGNFIYIYKTLPRNMHISHTDDRDIVQIQKIYTHRIKSVELIDNPSKYWIDEINKHRKKIKEIQKTEIWEDYKEPCWYHELIKDENKMKNLTKYYGLK